MSRRKQTSVPIPVNMPAYGVYLIESHHRHDFRMEYTRHSFLKIIYTLKGSGRLHLQHAKNTYTIGKDNILLVPADVSHRIEDRAGEPLSLYALCVERRVISGFEDYDFERHPVVLREVPLRADITAALRRIFYEQTIRKYAGSMLTVGLAYQVMALVSRMRRRGIVEASETSEVRAVAALTRVKGYVEDLDHSFHQEDTIDRVANRLGMSRRRFTELFREVTGTTWQKYLQGLRLAYAKALMESTDRTLLSISFECGYNDFSTFYRAFRKETGKSPEAWRAGNP